MQYQDTTSKSHNIFANPKCNLEITNIVLFIKIIEMIERSLEKIILSSSKKVRSITITGPRQSGKTTLVKKLFPNHEYINLESPINKQIAHSDPESFFLRNKDIIFDEIQNIPELFSYIQIHIDSNNRKGQFILTGSQNFSLMERISQSLAGRTYIYKLFPLTISELKKAKYFVNDYKEHVFKGFYPEVYYENQDIRKWAESYIETYVEKDIRNLFKIRDLTKFFSFLKICAGRIGQLVNYTNLSNEIGISDNTIKEWLGILEKSYIIFILKPYYNNFNKRITKSPKIYFYDTSLACSLLEIHDPKQLDFHFMKGQLFENFIIADLIKNKYNKGYLPSSYFWRDSTGNEIDYLEEENGKINAIEIKASNTFNIDYIKNIDTFRKIAKEKIDSVNLIYNGVQKFFIHDVKITPWQDFLIKNP